MDVAYHALTALGFNAGSLAPWLCWTALGLLGLVFIGLGYLLLLGTVVGWRILLDQQVRITRRRAMAVIAAQDAAKALAEAKARRTRSEIEAAEAAHQLAQRTEAAQRERRRHQEEVAHLRAEVDKSKGEILERDARLRSITAELADRDEKLKLAKQRAQELMLEIDEIQRAEAHARQEQREAAAALEAAKDREGDLRTILRRLDELAPALAAGVGA